MTSQRIGRRIPRIRDLKVASLPAEIPVFPLSGAMLLPRGKLPLNIFEPRYVALVEDALAGNRLLGMIQPVRGEEEHDDDPEDETAAARRRRAPESGTGPLYGVGCLGRIISFAEREDGTASITLLGLARFRVQHELEPARAYRRLTVGYDDFRNDLDEPGEIAFDREELLESLRRFFTHRGFDARWEAIEQMDDETLITTISMICPFPPAEKQALLEAPGLAERALTLQALLEMAGHETDGGGPSHAV